MSARTRVAVVTGGARGIGAAIALRLAADGIDIAVLDLDEAACADTVTAIERLGRRAFAVGADVSGEPQVVAAVRRVADEPGHPRCWSTTPACCATGSRSRCPWTTGTPCSTSTCARRSS